MGIIRLNRFDPLLRLGSSASGLRGMLPQPRQERKMAGLRGKRAASELLTGKYLLFIETVAADNHRNL